MSYTMLFPAICFTIFWSGSTRGASVDLVGQASPMFLNFQLVIEKILQLMGPKESKLLAINQPSWSNPSTTALMAHGVIIVQAWQHQKEPSEFNNYMKSHNISRMLADPHILRLFSCLVRSASAAIFCSWSSLRITPSFCFSFNEAICLSFFSMALAFLVMSSGVGGLWTGAASSLSVLLLLGTSWEVQMNVPRTWKERWETEHTSMFFLFCLRCLFRLAGFDSTIKPTGMSGPFWACFVPGGAYFLGASTSSLPLCFEGIS